VITGFNTDVEHDGVVYHVQTEDKGLDSPMILSLVYVGGAILASKRAPYEDLIAAGFSDEALSERLKRQHRLICAAILSGRLNELKKMGAREVVASVSESELAPPLAEVPEAYAPGIAGGTNSGPEDDSASAMVGSMESSTFASDMTAQAAADSGSDAAQDAKGEEGLVVALLDEQEFSSGDAPTLRVRVSKRSGEEEKPLGNVVVSVKILGTTFRPLIFSLKTQRDGTAEVSTEIPHFTSGRAAVLIRAVALGSAAELRRVIHPSK
jgi:hypothetical protein